MYLGRYHIKNIYFYGNIISRKYYLQFVGPLHARETLLCPPEPAQVRSALLDITHSEGDKPCHVCLVKKQHGVNCNYCTSATTKNFARTKLTAIASRNLVMSRRIRKLPQVVNQIMTMQRVELWEAI